MAWLHMLGGAAGAVDRAVAMAMHVSGKRDRARANSMSHAERVEALEAIARLYPDPAAFFIPPPAIDPSLREVRRGVWDAKWPSAFETFLPALAETYASSVENRTAHARLFLGERGRPAIVALHGYMGGQWVIEENHWPIAWLAKRGFDTALAILPFHGARAGSRRGAPPFPSADPRITNEGFRQAVVDVLSLVRFLRDRGAPHVGVMGASLGGYTTALIATLSDDVDFVMPMIPLASIADFAREQGQLGVGAAADEQRDALDRAYRIVSPFARAPRVKPSRALVFGADNDRITPSQHAKKLAAHFQCAHVTMPGGHLLQLGRSGGFRALGAMLEREGLMEPRPHRR